MRAHQTLLKSEIGNCQSLLIMFVCLLLSVSTTLDNKQPKCFHFCLSGEIRLMCRYFFLVAQQQALFPFLIITLYYNKYQLGADTGNRT
jgi:hypothetical protein